MKVCFPTQRELTNDSSLRLTKHAKAEEKEGDIYTFNKLVFINFINFSLLLEKIEIQHRDFGSTISTTNNSLKDFDKVNNLLLSF